MLYRKVKIKIEEWLKNDKEALLITGARQVGKSYIIKQTLKENNIDYIDFDLINDTQILNALTKALNKDIETFISVLRVSSKRVINENTVIFIDEVQECKEIVTIIKYLLEYGKYRYILSGSLLGVELVDLRSAPVGYLKILEMYPLDLEEFLIANGLGNDVLTSLQKSFLNKQPVNEFIHNELINAFYKYLIVGGMPAAVQEYINTGDFMRVKGIHDEIIQLYKLDFTKYEQKNKLKLIKTYDLIPSELNMKNKRYILKNLDKELRFERFENSFNWLESAGVSLPCYNVTEFMIPLEASKKSNLFKLFLSDVGMLTSLYGTATILELLNNGKNINCGAMFENVIAQELKAHGFKLYYFNTKKHGEVDFLIEYNNKLLPIEVKSGKDYQSHSALSYFINQKTFNEAFVFSNNNVKTNNNVFYLPIYMIMFLHSDFNIERKEKLDLSSLSLHINSL